MQFVTDRLRDWILTRRATMLGVGPMSKTTTRAAVRLANRYRAPVALIPSRRQVDAREFGGGYVEGWSTETFAEYVRSIDAGGYALLSRDHSGPWQSYTENGDEATLPNAMEEAKRSLSDDIANGFDLLHIDPSPALDRGFTGDDVDDMAVELIAHCVGQMPKGRHCVFEVGTDEQDAAPESLLVTHMRMMRITEKLDRFGLPRPLFYVAQTGTKVVEARNIGSFDQPLTVKGSLPSTVHLPAILRLCESNGLLLKEHNADYLSDDALRWHRRYGIHAANVAPEFGVTETRELLACLSELGMESDVEAFSDLVLTGGRWVKWMAPQTSASDRERTEIAGHYHFSDPWVVELREEAARRAQSAGFDLEKRIEDRVEESIDRYLRFFGYGGFHA